MAPHPIFTERTVREGNPVFLIGPGLNAANMDAKGWLDYTRVWIAPSGTNVSIVIQLRPLHRIDLEGYLAAKVGSYYIEFRNSEGWDIACKPAVLIHYFENGSSYVVKNDKGFSTFLAGDKLTMPKSMSLLGSSHSIKVTEIDLENRIATIQILVEQPELPREWPIQGPYQTPWIKWQEIENGLSSLLVTNGRPYYFPKNGFWHKMIENIAHYNDQLLNNLTIQNRSAVKIELLQNMRQLIEKEISKDGYQQPFGLDDAIEELRDGHPS